MASVNKVIIVGNLGKDPEVRYTPSNEAIATITVATSSKYKDKKTGETKEQTEWHKIVFFGRLAEVVGEYLGKGSSVYVEGRLRTRKWTDDKGVDRYVTEILGDQMQMLGSKQDDQRVKQANTPKSDQRAGKYTPQNNDDLDSDIPF